VNDGSTDRTQDVLLEMAESDCRVKAVILSRNFGKDIALSAGLDYARGKAVIPMDVDMQDPPELILKFVEAWKEGYEIIYGVRVDRQGDGWLKRTSAGWFYRLFNWVSDTPIPENVGDFRLLDRRVVEAIKRMPERDRFMKGIFSWVGFRSKGIEFERTSRAQGETKWSWFKLIAFAISGIFSFSAWPLRIWSMMGGLVALLSFFYGTFLVVRTLFLGVDVPGYASIIVSVLFIGGMNLVGIGMLGEYLARVYKEAKARPLYVVRETVNLEDG